MLRKTGRVSWEVTRLGAAKPSRFTNKREAQDAHAAERSMVEAYAATAALYGRENVSTKVWLQEYHGNKLVCETTTPAAQE